MQLRPLSCTLYPLTLKLGCKVVSYQGAHVDTSKSAGGSDSAEESTALFNQVVRLGVSPSHPIYNLVAKTCPLIVKHVSKFVYCQSGHVDTSNTASGSDSAEESFILLKVRPGVTRHRQPKQRFVTFSKELTQSKPTTSQSKRLRMASATRT